MLVCLMEWEAARRNILADMHVNPHNVSDVIRRDDGQPYMNLVGEEFGYPITEESYARLCEWLDRQ